MKKVAKLLIIDPEGNYLLMHRSDHPTFGRDPDLPGGTLEDGESLLGAMLREVKEEAGVEVSVDDADQVYSGIDYSMHGTYYVLFVTRLKKRPKITMSWEHSSYEWLDRNEFLRKVKNAKDTYMHMVGDVLERDNLSP